MKLKVFLGNATLPMEKVAHLALRELVNNEVALDVLDEFGGTLATLLIVRNTGGIYRCFNGISLRNAGFLVDGFGQVLDELPIGFAPGHWPIDRGEKS